jgi:hypothetical protein
MVVQVKHINFAEAMMHPMPQVTAFAIQPGYPARYFNTQSLK